MMGFPCRPLLGKVVSGRMWSGDWKDKKKKKLLKQTRVRFFDLKAVSGQKSGDKEKELEMLFLSLPCVGHYISQGR